MSNIANKEIIVSNKILPPKYDGKESMPQFERRIEKYLAEINKNKYDKLLDFLNLWLKMTEKKFMSLTDIKNIPEKLLLGDAKHNRNILRRHGQDLMILFGIDTTIDDETDSDDINDNYITDFVKKILNAFGYTMITRMKADIKEKNIQRVFYTIKKR